MQAKGTNLSRHYALKLYLSLEAESSSKDSRYPKLGLVKGSYRTASVISESQMLSKMPKPKIPAATVNEEETSIRPSYKSHLNKSVEFSPNKSKEPEQRKYQTYEIDTQILSSSYPPGFQSPSKPSYREEVLEQVHSETSVKLVMMEKKFERLNETLNLKENLLSQAQTDIESLKQQLSHKEQEHNQLKQKWRMEAEDSLRQWKSKHDEMRNKYQNLERRVSETDEEMLKLRSEKDKLAKDVAFLETQSAESKKLEREDFKDHTKKIEQKLESEKHVTKTLSTDLQVLKKENETLAEALSAKADSIKKMKQSLADAKEDLRKEKVKTEQLSKERSSLKGK